MSDPFEDFKVFLPRHLTALQKTELLNDLRSFPGTKGFYLADGPDEELLQGDGWRGFVHIRFDTRESRVIAGIIVSNSCDIDVRNKRDQDPNVLFAPIMPLASFANVLSSLRPPDAVQQKIEQVRRQEVTSIFFLPHVQALNDEAVVMLDDIHSHPLQHFMGTERSRLFRLSQYGFYVFLFKLSVHLTRFGESVPRFPVTRPSLPAA